MTKVLYVCLGNICRSPAAEAILRKKAQERGLDVHVESCGLGDWHIGELADARTRESAFKRGYSLGGRAKKIPAQFLDQFDVIFVADEAILHELQHHAKIPEKKAKIHMMTAYSPLFKNKKVPDPYYGGESGFEHVLDMLEDSADGFLDHLEKGDL